MKLSEITPKCYILALIIREDGERFLLGDGAFEFKESQQHFQPNTFANDVVELQGADGQLLAGQVRRSNTQTFTGYIGDASMSKETVEKYRRQFFAFFKKNHYYTVIYVDSEGKAIQQQRGYISEAPSVPELWQKFPEWSVGICFEDPDYYEYAEDDSGDETFANNVSVKLATEVSGGLVWDSVGAVANPIPQSATSNIFDYYNLPTQNIEPASHFDYEWQESAVPAVIQFLRPDGYDYVYFGTDDAVPDGAQAQIGFFDTDGNFGGWANTNEFGWFRLEEISKFFVWATREPGKEFQNMRVTLAYSDSEDSPEYEDFANPKTIDGFVWEDGGTGGPTTVTVQGVDDAKPVWTVTGPAVDPTLTNITTGQALSWTGTVPEGQTLIVNMNEMTATLEGANVFEFISGAWITLRPGNNQVSYTATGASSPSKLSWNGVLG